MEMLKIVLSISICVFVSSVTSLEQHRKVYIAYMGSLPTEGEYSASMHHSEIITQIVDPSFANKSLVRSYERSFNGFAAYLSEEEKEKLTRTAGVVSVFPCQKSQLQTTRSWDFMGLTTTSERRPAVESDIIVGVIDTGIWPELPSFSDEGFGPIPTKWKGACDGGIDFVCNRKIIGARFYSSKSMDVSARDKDGHGTHVASTIAGNQVIDASYYGLAQGIARGGVPSARLAIYKACHPRCYATDVLAAFDQAIADGVDIISVSIGFDNSTDLISDPIAIGAFHALERGILTVNSAGNKGPSLSSINISAPWVLTVGASDTDRKIVDKLILGDGSILVGYGINAFPWSGVSLPLVYGKEVTKSCSETQARNCVVECLENNLIRQSIVLCDHQPSFEQELEPGKASGALGWIVPSDKNFSLIMPSPVVRLRKNDIDVVKIFKESTTKTEARILKSEPINNIGAPFVASFSSRGPSMLDIIKPDVIAPGVEILAAYSPIASPSTVPWDKRSVKFSIMSGTSMACPHVAAAAAFVKSFHPEWSPSAIKSALMTTAFELRVSSTLYSETEFAFGSGHIDPLRAINPGLVYETSVEEYLMIWCNISRTLGSPNSTCSMNLTPRELNYPSMAAKVQPKHAFNVPFPRTLMNVGEGSSTYVASIEGDPSKLNFSVEPNTLHFTRLNEKMKFVVTVSGEKMKPLTLERMSLLWTDGVHKVRSPIVIYTSDGERAPATSRFHIIFVVLIMLSLY